MKVLHFYKTYFPDSVGGVEQVINTIMMSTSVLGVESQVLSLTSNRVNRPVIINGHYVHRCRSTVEIASTPFSLSALAKFATLAKQVDIIHYHFPWPFMDMAHFICRIKKPCVVTYHADIVRQKYWFKLYQPLLRYFLSSVCCVVATSPNYLASSEVLQLIADKTTVIPIGLDKDRYPKPNNWAVSRWRQCLPEKFFFFIGVFRYYKGLDTLIDAACQFDYPIVIAGSGPMELALKARVKKLKLENVYFLGQITDEDKVALFLLCYALVFPSNARAEAFGVSLLEAAMFGRPMICCEIGSGTTFVNIDKQTGLVVPPNDALALGQAMAFLWQNPTKIKIMGQQAEKRYRQHFEAKKMGQSYFKLYQELIVSA